MSALPRPARFAAVLLVPTLLLGACSTGETGAPAGSGPAVADDGPLVIYSGRSEDLVAPLIEQFEEKTGIETEVRYAGSAEQAQLLLTEGKNSPGHVFFSQEAGALGLLGEQGLLVELPEEVLSQVPETYTAQDDTWVGVTGRARVVVYDSEQVDAADVPDTAAEIVDPRWSGQVAVAPGNASFLSFVTALRLVEGEDGATEWLSALATNGVQTYEKNGAILEAVGAGTAQLGLINHYYWYSAAAEQGAENMRAQLVFGQSGDPAALVNATGVGILPQGEGRSDARQFVDFLLSEQAQTYFATTEFEYPLVPGVAGPEGVPALDSLQGPAIDLSDLGTVDESAALVDAAGITLG